jgi:hypothetical protein
MKRFSFNDLWMMYKSGGYTLPLTYLAECWWFDVSRGVSTHHRMQTAEFLESEIHKEHCVIYMSSWTSVIKVSTKQALIKLNLITDEAPILVDVGSGKGKVLIAWAEDKFISSKIKDIVGVEFSKKLFEICKENLIRYKQKSITPKIFCSDILDTNIMSFSSPYIFYMYNPFDEQIMKSFLSKLLYDFSDGRHFILIYNNPVHHDILVESGLEMIDSIDHWHANGRVNYYSYPLITND